MNIDRTPGILAAVNYLGLGHHLPCVDVSKCRFPKPKTSRIKSAIIAIKMMFS